MNNTVIEFHIEINKKKNLIKEEKQRKYSHSYAFQFMSFYFEFTKNRNNKKSKAHYYFTKHIGRIDAKQIIN